MASGRDSSYLLADGDDDSVFSDSPAQATLPSRARLRLPQKHSYLQLRHDSSSGYEIPTGEPPAAVGGGVTEEAAAAAAAAAAGGATGPHSYQNCSLAGGLPSTSLAGLPSTSLSGLPSASSGIPGPSGCGGGAAAAAGAAGTSVDDIQFSFDAASELNPRHSVASLLSQISGVAIDVDPGKTSWC